MAFKKGNYSGAHFGKEIDPREAQKKAVQKRKENAALLDAILSILDVEELDTDKTNQITGRMLLANKDRLKRFVEDGRMPVELQQRARQLLGNDYVKATKIGNRMRDEVHGKPVQRDEVTTVAEDNVTLIDFMPKNV